MKENSREKVLRMLDDLLDTIPESDWVAFKKGVCDEIDAKYRILASQYPGIVLAYGESRIREVAALFVWNEKRGGRDSWHRPPDDPGPQPLSPDSMRTLELA